MKQLLRPIFVAVLSVLLVAGASIPSDAAGRGEMHHGRSGYDGAWSVAIYTMRGDCSAYRAAVRITGGRVLGGDGSYQVSGAVRPNGSIRVMVSAMGRYGYGSGRLSGNRGGGHWRTSSGECSGRWVASRRG